ncbi:MAG: hypothetical protein IKB25_13555 [Lentisphaeria bacterium]|nr:hypothetical protein [Lentisphaeria bacterium]
MNRIISLAAGLLLPLAAATTDFTTTPFISLHPSADLKTYSGFNGFQPYEFNLEKPSVMVPADAHVQLATDGKTLRINAACELGPKGLLARVNPPSGGAMVFRDDCYEFVLFPNPKDKTENYHFFINGKGAVFVQAMKKGKFIDWKLDKKFKSEYSGDTWHLQLDLPLAQFGLKDLKPGQAFGLRICRNWRNLNLKYYDGGIQSTWNQIRAAFIGVEKLPLIYYRPDAPAVDFFSVVTRKDRKPDCKFRITNPSSKKQTFYAEYRHVLELSQPASGNWVIELGPKESKVFEMPIPQVLNNEQVLTKLEVKSADKKTVFYHRSIAWKQGKDKDLFGQIGGSLVYITPRMAYYPSTNKMRLQVNCKAEKNLAKLKRLRVVISTEKDVKIAEFELPRPDAEKMSEGIFQLPDLKAYTRTKNPSGKYKMSLIPEGLNYKPIVIPFERKIFEWEGNNIGKKPRLIPPFTPLKVRNNKFIDAILKTYTMNGLGLLAAVKTDGHDILTKDGMVLEAVIGGKTYQAKSTGFKFTKKSDLEVKVESTWQAGPLKAKAEGIMGFDGLMWYTFKLQPCAQPVQSLKLKLAFPEKEVPLYHICTDGLRFNNGGALMKGNGRIWKSADAARSEIQNDFVPYIWLGSEGPGFAIFADNDRGWVRVKDVVSQELFRKNGKIEMVWNFVTNAPANHKFLPIRFGFQASPVKPMPENWRAQMTWNLTWKNKTIQKYIKNRTLFAGGDMGRGTMTNQYVPRNNDYSLWKVAREIKKTGVVPPGFLDKWIAGYPTEEIRKKYRGEVSYFLYMLRGCKTYPDARIMLYTNPRGLRIDSDESNTFINDWLREEFHDYRTQKVPVNTGHAYSANPVESFRDYLLWGYKNFFDNEIDDQLYWDNLFLTSCYAQNGLEASYRLPDGRIQPSMEMDNIRQLIRRTAVFMLDRGLKPDNMVHMTNTSILPVLSFAQQQLDWEDNDGLAPFQERYTKEYIRALSIGYQAGCLPCVLGKIAGKSGSKEMNWCIRTGTGVILTHELRWARPDVDCYWNIMEKWFEFGYGTPAVKVYNYWKKDYPVRITGGDNTSIYLEKGKQSQLLICSYGPDTTLNVSVNGKQITKAVNLETGKPLPVQNGKLQIKLAKYDLIYLGLETK